MAMGLSVPEHHHSCMPLLFTYTSSSSKAQSLADMDRQMKPSADWQAEFFQCSRKMSDSQISSHRKCMPQL